MGPPWTRLVVQHILKIIYWIEIWVILWSSQHLELFVLYLKPFLNIFLMWKCAFYSLCNLGICDKRKIHLNSRTQDSQQNIAQSISLHLASSIVQQIIDPHLPGSVYDVKENQIHEIRPPSSLALWSISYPHIPIPGACSWSAAIQLHMQQVVMHCDAHSQH